MKPKRISEVPDSNDGGVNLALFQLNIMLCIAAWHAGGAGNEKASQNLPEYNQSMGGHDSPTGLQKGWLDASLGSKKAQRAYEIRTGEPKGGSIDWHYVGETRKQKTPHVAMRLRRMLTTCPR